jgi:hypothetical protein
MCFLKIGFFQGPGTNLQTTPTVAPLELARSPRSSQLLTMVAANDYNSLIDAVANQA